MLTRFTDANDRVFLINLDHVEVVESVTSTLRVKSILYIRDERYDVQEDIDYILAAQHE